eukprot:8938820-Prorocentrum_lima.AAC.1
MWAWKCSQNKSRRHVVPEYWEGPFFSDTLGLVRDRRGTVRPEPPALCAPPPGLVARSLA